MQELRSCFAGFVSVSAFCPGAVALFSFPQRVVCLKKRIVQSPCGFEVERFCGLL